MNPTHQPVQTPPEVAILQPKPNYLKTIIFSVLIIITLSLIAYLVFQNQKLQKQVLNPQISPTIQAPSQTSKTVSSISISPDETAGWKTYRGDGFDFRYPNNFKISEKLTDQSFTKYPKTKYLSISENNNSEDGAVLLIYALPFIKQADQIQITKDFANTSEENITITPTTIGGVKGLEYKLPAMYEYSLSIVDKSNQTFLFSKSGGYENIKKLDQILSTFKFVDNKQNNTDLPYGWTYYKDSTCNVDIPIPPAKLDIDKRSWKIEINSNYDLLGFFKGNVITAIHRNPDEASGYISGMVSIICGQTNESLTKLNADFHSYLTLQTQQNTSPEGLIELTSNNNVTMWGFPSNEMAFVGGMFDPKQKYYLIVNSGKWYLITKKSDSTNPEINQQTNQIFNFIRFN
jgi:hypothetical protein